MFGHPVPVLRQICTKTRRNPALKERCASEGGQTATRIWDSVLRKNSCEGGSGQVSISMVLVPLCLLTVLVACRHPPGSTEGQDRPVLQLDSTSFSNEGAIAQRNTCDGADLSPSLQWSAGPAGTKSFALVMHDPDAEFDFTHWLVYNIPPSVHSLSEGASGHSAMPQGSLEGTNSFNRFGYSGPCPPSGKPHHYLFELYALDSRFNLGTGAMRNNFDSAVARHILAEGRMTGTYQSAGR
jgi:Raf kinase inhibitor-like YbhB/YbcL family protein